MAMKTKILSFVPESFMFVGADHDNEGKLGLVTFMEYSEMDKVAQQSTEEALKDDKGYQVLKDMVERKVYQTPDIQDKQARKALSDIWSILYHKFLIDELRQNGWTILQCRSEDFEGLDLTKYPLHIG